MRELHGVLAFPKYNLRQLEQHAIFFDMLHLIDRVLAPITLNADEFLDLDFLEERGFVAHTNPAEVRRIKQFVPLTVIEDETLLDFKADEAIRLAAAKLKMVYELEAVPICRFELPNHLEDTVLADHCLMQCITKIAFEKLPLPSDDSSWQNIFDFKAESHDKLWAFRRFLHTLVTKKQTEAEIRDDIEWSLNEYTRAMRLHNIKAGNGFVEVYVIPALEVLEDLAKLNWSKIAKGALSVKKRRVELMEAEMKAPGRECAYVFDARTRFVKNG